MFPQPIGEALFDLRVSKKADFKGTNLQKHLDGLELIPDGCYKVLEIDEKRSLLFPDGRRGAYLVYKSELVCALLNKKIHSSYAKELRKNIRHSVEITINKNFLSPKHPEGVTETIEFFTSSPEKAKQDAKAHCHILTGKEITWEVQPGRGLVGVNWPDEYIIGEPKLIIY